MNTELRTSATPDSLPLAPGLAERVDEQVTRFVDGLLTEDVQGDAFKSKLDSAFQLGREEIAVTSALLNGRFMTRTMIGMDDSPAVKAVATLRRHLDELNPGNEGDLLSPNRILGIIPFGNRLRSYLRRFQSAGAQLQAAVQQIYAACDDLQRDGIEIDACRAKLWDAMQRLKAAIRFAEELDTRIAAKVEVLRAGDPQRAHALEQEVLFYVRQNLTDMLTQQAVCANGYLSLDVLRKTCRETIVGCNRVATTGMSALSVAHTVACATGAQVKVMNMLTGVNATVENLLVASGKALGAHAERTARFASNPMLGIEKLKETFDLTFAAIDEMDGFRAKALEAMAQSSAALREQIARAETYLDRERRSQARAVVAGSAPGPVAL
ncbi:MAG: toxic anion resistance protein [Burkholderiales bacterium]